MNRLVLTALAVLAVGAACSDDHVGRPCDLSTGEVQDI
jgi:hypothetical protein